MRNIQQFDKLNLVNETREKNAGKRLAIDNDHMEQMQEQLQKLIAYREEYKEKLNQQINQIESAESIRDYHNFIRVLDKAIEDQRLVVDQSVQQSAQSREQWIHSKNEVRKVDKIKEHAIKENRYQESLREQKQSDELSLNFQTRHQDNNSFA